MSSPAEVIEALKSQLQENSNLSYVNDNLILIGAREGLTVFPAICLDREGLEEQEYVYPKARLKMTVVLIILVNVHDKDSQLSGQGNIKGTLDVENDVKLAIDSDRTLGGEAIHVEIMDSEDAIVEYPTRSVNLRVSILFEQTRSVRT